MVPKNIGIISKMVVFEIRLLPNSPMSRSLPESTVMVTINYSVGDGDDDEAIMMIMMINDGAGGAGDDDDDGDHE